ncbi:hypothetical protein P3S67_028942 [Capsicum chacoense]
MEGYFGYVPQLKNGDIVQLYVSHLVDEPHVVSDVPAIEYISHVGGESSTSFDKESSQDCGISEKLGYEDGSIEAATPQEPFVSENLNSCAATTSVEECNVFGAASSNGEELGGIEENLGSGVAATIVQNLSSAPSASIVENSGGSGVAATAEQNLNSGGGGFAATGEKILDSDCGSAPHGEQNLGGTTFVTISDIPIISSE